MSKITISIFQVVRWKIWLENTLNMVYEHFMQLIRDGKYFQKKSYLLQFSEFISIYIINLIYINFNLLIKLDKNMALKLITLLIILLLEVLSERAILVLDQSTFTTALSSYKYLLVYYYDDACAQCTSATTMYHTFNSLYTNWNHPGQQNLFVFSTDMQFAQISLKNNEKIFASQKIQSVPQFRLHVKDKKQAYRYPLLQYNYQNLWKMGLWIKRITQKYFPIYESLQIVEKTISQSSKYLIISNQYEEGYKYFLASQGYLQNLDINYVRVSNIDLDEKSIMLKNREYSKIIPKCFSYGQNFTQNKKNSQKCQNIITNFKYRGFHHWSDEIVNNLYNKNYQVLLIITSNQTVSQDYVRQLSDIKDQLDEQYTGYLLPLFVVADIYYDLQVSITIKRYIGAFDIRGYQYPYPMVAYLWSNQQGTIIKYMYQKKCKTCPQTQYTLKQWLFKAMKHELKRDMRGQISQTEIKTVYSAIQQRSYIKIYLSELLLLLQNYTNPNENQKNPVIYLFIMWRTNFESQVINHQLDRWWQKQTYKTPFFSYDFYDNEIPENINIQKFPAFMVYYNNRYFQIKQGITNQTEVQQMIKRIENNSSLKN